LAKIQPNLTTNKSDVIITEKILLNMQKIKKGLDYTLFIWYSIFTSEKRGLFFCAHF